MITRPTLLLVPLLALIGACRGPTWVVESREIPVHVLLTAPELLQGGGTIPTRVVVDCRELVNGPVRFPPCTPTIALATTYLKCGSHTVTVETHGGRRRAARAVKVGEETWVLITLTEGGIGIGSGDEDPLAAKCNSITIPLLND